MPFNLLNPYKKKSVFSKFLKKNKKKKPSLNYNEMVNNFYEKNKK